jgi:phosphoribosylformylglycinamidine cyclo-ligase
MKENHLSYKKAGVDIEQANALVKDIRTIANRTHRTGVLGGIGGFGALFEIPPGYRQPVLVSGTDGVGTKLKLAIEMNKHDTIGIDLVAMCVNDVACLGAEPLFFLDYFATGRLNTNQAREIISGIGKGCEIAGAALIGGETAEMPGMYQNDDYDLAGFCVGVVEKDQIIKASLVQSGDYLIAISSSGPHSNGFSLIRKVLDQAQTSLETPFESSTLGQVLLTPTKIYTNVIKKLRAALPVHAIAHITGGGLIDNLPRVLPPFTQAIINRQSWQIPEIFRWLQQQGHIDTLEMFHAFNMGVGLVMAVPQEKAQTALDIIHSSGESGWIIGNIQSSSEASPFVTWQ